MLYTGGSLFSMTFRVYVSSNSSMGAITNHAARAVSAYGGTATCLLALKTIYTCNNGQP